MTYKDQQQLGKTLWAIADNLRGAMNADDFRDYMLSFLFLRYLSYNYEESAKKELGADYPTVQENDNRTPLSVWYDDNKSDVPEFEKQMRRKIHYVIEPQHLWSNISEMARTAHSVQSIPGISVKVYHSTLPYYLYKINHFCLL